jgi:hypothetical protein
MLKALVTSNVRVVYEAVGPNLPAVMKALAATIQEDFRRSGLIMDVCSWNVLDVMVEDFNYYVTIWPMAE